MPKFLLLLFQLMRAATFFCFALMLLGIAVGLYARADEPTEHRLTSLETKVDYLAQEYEDLKKYLYAGLFGTAGLCGEAGLRLMRRKADNGGDE